MQNQIMIFRRCLTVRFKHSGKNSSRVDLVANRQEVLSSLINFSHILQFQLVYSYGLWTPVISRFTKTWDWTAGTGDALLMNWQQPYTTLTTHAGVQVISICGWSKICGNVYGSENVHVVVQTNLKLKVISLNGRPPAYKFSKTKAWQNLKICLPVIVSICVKCASQLEPLVWVIILRSEFKHTDRWSVSLSSLPICLHNLQICKASGRSASLWRPAIQVSKVGIKTRSRCSVASRILFVTPFSLAEGVPQQDEFVMSSDDTQPCDC